MKKTLLLVLALSITTVSCTEKQISDALKMAQEALGDGSTPLTTEQVAAGLKEALAKGASYAASTASAENGYWNNRQLRIPLPPEIQNIESKMRQIGLGNLVDRFLETMNHGAELAAKEAQPIFEDVIRGMTVEDAWNILRGEQDAATQYLHDKGHRRLYGAFKPHISEALQKVDATKHYTDIVTAYNRIPGVRRIDPDLENYVTEKALEGLYFLVAREEANIRQNVGARTTDLLKKVFDEVNQRQG